MIEKKDLIIAVLATFCLTATLFMIIPTRSQYDPWTDLNDDGVIDSTDLGTLGIGWGTFGDPAKTVTIVGHTNKLAYTISTTAAPAPAVFYSPWIIVDGYSKVVVSVQTDASLNQYWLWTSNLVGGTTFYADWAGNFGGTIVRTYDTPNQQICVGFINQDAVTRNVWVDVYLIP